MKKMIIVLTGGLGNQLFQLQFAKYIQSKEDYKVYFDICLGKPRGKNGSPDSFYYGIPGEVVKPKESNLASKAIGYILRSSYAPSKLEKRSISRFVAKICASIVLSIHFKTFVTALSPRDLGYDQNFNPRKRRMITMGYFQSYLFSTENGNKDKIFPKSPKSKEIDFHKKLAEIEKPIIVHVRRSDYSSEEKFGLLGPKYYEQAIEEISARTKSSKIWLFSDEPSIAISLIPDRYLETLRIIQEVDDSPANTLEVMRMGAGYVIANSTFSWWGAFSSYTNNPPVALPALWFKNMNSPTKLAPPSWIQVDPDFL